MICVDEAGSDVEGTASRLRAKYPGVERVGPSYRKQEDDPDARRQRPASLAYSCNLWDREQIKVLARKVKEEVGRVDVLVTCAGSPEEGLFDTVSRTLMSHYWVGIYYWC